MKMNYRKHLMLVLMTVFFAGFLLPSTGFSLPSQKGLINDFAGTLTPQEISKLEKQSAASAVKVIIVTDKEASESYAKMARAVFNDWKLKDNDVLVIFSVSGKNATLRIEPGSAIARILSDNKIKNIDSSAKQLLIKNRTGEAFSLIISSVDKEVRSAANAEMMFIILLLSLALAVVAVITVIFLKRAKKTQEGREEIEIELNPIQTDLLRMGEKVGTYSRKIGMLSNETKAKFSAKLAFVSSSKISEYLSEVDDIRAAIGGESSQSQLISSCVKLKNNVDQIQESFALVDRLMVDENTHSNDSIQPEKVTAASKNKNESVNPFHSSQPQGTSGSARKSTVSDNGRGGGNTHTTIVKNTTVYQDSNPGLAPLIVLGAMSGHHDHHDHYVHDDRMPTHGGERIIRDGNIDEREVHFQTEGNGRDDRESHFATEPPVIDNPFSRDERETTMTMSSGSDERETTMAMGSGSDERETSFVMESSAEIRDTGSDSDRSGTEY